MIEDPLGCVEYDETGQGPSLLLVPGSCSTGSAWRAVTVALEGRYRTIATSLPGYGGTAERRTGADRSIGLVAEAIERAISQAGSPVNLVGHSFGGEVALAVALRGRVELHSLAIFEAPAPDMLRAFGRTEPYGRFRAMTEAYLSDFGSGNREAIGAMIDFYGGPGTFASWPRQIRSHVANATATNILDWQSAYGAGYDPDALAELKLPVLVVVGGESHPAVREANSLIADAIPGAAFATIEGASHFMLATHPKEVASLIVRHVSR